MAAEKVLFVTGRLAEQALRRVLARIPPQLGLEPEVAVLGISVAALLHVDWIARKLQVPEGTRRVLLPGWCQGDLAALEQQFRVPFERGPKDLHDLPEYLGSPPAARPGYGAWEIEILAEINHAPQLTESELIRTAEQYRAAGADVIDLGMIPGRSWEGVGSVTRRLVSAGFRVSIDSFDRREVEQAVDAGAELVLSCSAANVDWAADLPAELVVIPDPPDDLESLRSTVDRLHACRPAGRPFRLDPILEPIGFGFARSLGRYLSVRRDWPEAEILMGIGNVTELTEADSAAIHLLLLGFCQELRIRSVLTTQVIPWCRTAVAELDIARRIVHYAVTRQVLPKHLDPRLVMLRDVARERLAPDELAELAAQIRDPNYRVFVAGDEIHVMNRDGHWRGTDPFALFDALGPVDPAHAFYLGYELCKAATALTVGKRYVQDEALRWGFLTREERSAHERRRAAESGPAP